MRLARRVPYGKVEPVKLSSSVSISGPPATEKPISAKITISSSQTRLIGWMRPSAAGLARQGG